MNTTAATRSLHRAPVLAPAGGPLAGPPPLLPRVDRPAWLTAYVAALAVCDALAMAGATLLAKMPWLGLAPADLSIRSLRVPYSVLALATVPTWLVILALVDAYDVGPFGTTGLWTRIVRAGAQLLAVVAVAYYVLHLEMVGRGVLVAVIPLAVGFTLAGRSAVGAVLRHARRQGRARRTALVAGSRRGIEAVVAQLADRPAAGITPIDVLVVGEDPVTPEPEAATGPGVPPAPGASPRPEAATGPGASLRPHVPAPRGSLPVATGDPGRAVMAALAQSGAEALIVTGGLARGQLRDIAWRLEGTGVELLVIPAPGELDGLRSQIRPVAGLPLLYVD